MEEIKVQLGTYEKLHYKRGSIQVFQLYIKIRIRHACFSSQGNPSSSKSTKSRVNFQTHIAPPEVGSTSAPRTSAAPEGTKRNPFSVQLLDVGPKQAYGPKITT